MGCQEGWREESKKYVYFYKKEQDSMDKAVWQVVDKKTRELLPFQIYDWLGWVDWETDYNSCSFQFVYKMNELSDKERKSRKLVELANDVLIDFVASEHYNGHELDVYTKDIIKNALDPYGGFEVDGSKSLYEEFLEEVENMDNENQEGTFTPKGFGRITRFPTKLPF